MSEGTRGKPWICTRGCECCIKLESRIAELEKQVKQARLDALEEAAKIADDELEAEKGRDFSIRGHMMSIAAGYMDGCEEIRDKIKDMIKREREA